MSRASVSRFGRLGDLDLAGLDSSRVKPVTLIDNCHFLARHLVLLGMGKDWFVQCQDKVTEWDIRS